MSYRCPSCGGESLAEFHRQSSVPAHSCLLMTSREEAVAYPRGSICLAHCQACGFITNVEFDLGLSHYSTAYEETQGFSARFRQFSLDLARAWVDRYDIRGRSIVEIGCGKGEFLADMCEIGDNWGVGIDPAYVPERGDYSAAARMTFVQELYGEQHFSLDADVIVCRHTLEHIPDVGEFLANLRRSVGDRSDVVVLFEVPDVGRVLREGAFWDVYYEHCSYFTAGSLARLFRRHGFDVVDLRLEFDDQYVILEARPGSGSSPPSALEDDSEDIGRWVGDFRDALPATLGRWRRELVADRAAGRRSAIWGAGSKGVAYLNSLGADCGVEVAVDINPFKQGMYLAGTGTAVVAPEHLKSYSPDRVVMMNPVYADEISRHLEEMGLSVTLSSV